MPGTHQEARASWQTHSLCDEVRLPMRDQAKYNICKYVNFIPKGDWGGRPRRVHLLSFSLAQDEACYWKYGGILVSSRIFLRRKIFIKPQEFHRNHSQKSNLVGRKEMFMWFQWSLVVIRYLGNFIP